MKSPQFWFGICLLVICAMAPLVANALGQPYYVNVFGRLMIWAIAAVSLNLILGYGGMISFGHAAYLGIGAYTVAILAYYEIDNGWVQWSAAIGICGLVALIFAVISLRTRGLYFIMITMALAQMLYYLAVSAEEYGSDDGLILYFRSDFGIPGYSLDYPLHLYYTIFIVLLISLYVCHRLVNSRFGMVIRGARSNEQRMSAIGFSVYQYQIVCCVIAGVICGLAGVLSANMEKFVSPDLMYWTASGELIFMVVLGGMGSLFGPLAGAMVFWLLSEFLSRFTEHWHIIFGPFLILVVLFARHGINGLFVNKRKAGA